MAMVRPPAGRKKIKSICFTDWPRISKTRATHAKAPATIKSMEGIVNNPSDEATAKSAIPPREGTSMTRELIKMRTRVNRTINEYPRPFAE
jgi:hypothetical protein